MKPNIPSDFLIAQQTFYLPAGLTATDISFEKESHDYGALDFCMQGRRGKFRLGKITPTKIGQFTTLWKRSPTGPIAPFDSEDPIDFCVISVRNGERLGQFIFPKQVLCEKGIFSKGGKGGKRAMRLYPSWDSPDSRQAERTQSWQLDYFFEISPEQSVKSIPLLLDLFKA